MKSVFLGMLLTISRSWLGLGGAVPQGQQAQMSMQQNTENKRQGSHRSPGLCPHGLSVRALAWASEMMARAFKGARAEGTRPLTR